MFADSIEREAREPGADADGIAVLTGGVSRIDQAMKLLADGKAKRVLITGVYRGTTEAGAEAARQRGRPVFRLLRRHRQGGA